MSLATSALEAADALAAVERAADAAATALRPPARPAGTMSALAAAALLATFAGADLGAAIIGRIHEQLYPFNFEGTALDPSYLNRFHEESEALRVYNQNSRRWSDFIADVASGIHAPIRVQAFPSGR